MVSTIPINMDVPVPAFFIYPVSLFIILRLVNKSFLYA